LFGPLLFGPWTSGLRHFPIVSSGSQWLHEIKHDGFRVIARKGGPRVRLYSRPGNDFTRRFPLIVETLARLRSRSCIIDGEAVACEEEQRCFVRSRPSHVHDLAACAHAECATATDDHEIAEAHRVAFRILR
jgi:bifunctional non-homologous end joining protein LigD